MFWLLLLLPLLLATHAWSNYRRRKRLELFGDPATVRPLMPDVSLGLRRARFVLLLAAVALMVTALARPRMGSRLKEVTVSGMELMLAVDVSNSMLAEDFAPNRLERTKNAIGRLLEELRQDRVGLVVFAGDAYVQLPITADYTTARSFVQQISPTMVSRQGTAIGAAIDMAAAGFSSDSEGSRAIILITDGENHEDDPFSAAERAAARGITIHTIGIGTPEGAPISIAGDFIRDDEGEMVVSKLDEASLQRIALATGGAYIRSTGQSVGLSEIVARIGETEAREFTATMFEEYNEHYGVPLVAALLCLVCCWALPESQRRRSGRHR
ncbi:MAG: VWA domain-containing protein [Alistipes sp.]|nr:VWA domain-containing protein [Alistipes sp.]